MPLPNTPAFLERHDAFRVTLHCRHADDIFEAASQLRLPCRRASYALMLLPAIIAMMMLPLTLRVSPLIFAIFTCHEG